MWYKLKRIMMRPNGVEKQVRPKWWWQPWANTVLYCPLSSNTQDMSSYHRTITVDTTTYPWWQVTTWTYDGVASTYFYKGFLFFPLTDVSYQNYTTQVFLNYVWPRNDQWKFLFSLLWSSWVFDGNSDAAFVSNTNYWSIYASGDKISTTSPSSWWHLITLTRSWNTVNLYVDATLVVSWIASNTTTYQYWTLWNRNNWNQTIGWWLSEFIIENKTWTQQEVSDYYNQTKANYWL